MNRGTPLHFVERGIKGVRGKLFDAIITLMKKIFILMVILAFFLPVCRAAENFEYYPYNIRVKELLKEPTPESEPAFVFPIEVSLTGVSKDKKWYRFRVFYDLVFLGKYQFEGWTQVDPWKPFLNNATPEVINLK